jgi:hypothetical protein
MWVVFIKRTRATPLLHSCTNYRKIFAMALTHDEIRTRIIAALGPHVSIDPAWTDGMAARHLNLAILLNEYTDDASLETQIERIVECFIEHCKLSEEQCIAQLTVTPSKSGPGCVTAWFAHKEKELPPPPPPTAADEERAMLLRLVTMLQKTNIRTPSSPTEGSRHIEIKEASVCSEIEMLEALAIRFNVKGYDTRMIKLASIEFFISNYYASHKYEYTLFVKQDGLHVQLGELNFGNLQYSECIQNAPYTHKPSIIRVNPDLKKFESQIDKGLGDEHFKKFTSNSAWTYILLSMLVYNDHVFDTLTDMAVPRRRTASDAACELLSHFWKRGPDSPTGAHWPFLVQLMPREFAFHVDPMDTLRMF